MLSLPPQLHLIFISHSLDSGVNSPFLYCIKNSVVKKIQFFFFKKCIMYPLMYTHSETQLYTHSFSWLIAGVWPWAERSMEQRDSGFRIFSYCSSLQQITNNSQVTKQAFIFSYRCWLMLVFKSWDSEINSYKLRWFLKEQLNL